ncbi:MAG: TolC family protein, partial [Acidobacteria bacterium]|nr:TolC family protein [Acidobacteriota bacterium]
MRIFACCVLLYSTTVWSQMSSPEKSAIGRLQMGFDRFSHASEAALPDTPLPQTPDAFPSSPGAKPPQGNSKPAATAPGMLSIKDAEQLALRNNPQLSVARLMALASHQEKREIESSLWPAAVADLTGVDSRPSSRITAGGLNNPIIYQRAAVGAMVTQLITDFGHTSNLVSSAELSAKARDENAVANEDQIRLAVDRAFYAALEAQTMTRVAEQTVKTRQTLVDQVQALFDSKLRSELDLSFANVDLSQAKLLLLDAQNRQNASLAVLSQLLGYANVQNVQLVEDTTPIGPPPADVESLVSQAIRR